jgi:hypothetical protein
MGSPVDDTLDAFDRILGGTAGELTARERAAMTAARNVIRADTWTTEDQAVFNEQNIRNNAAIVKSIESLMLLLDIITKTMAEESLGQTLPEFPKSLLN